MTKEPIAYADQTGYVVFTSPTVKVSPHFLNNLTPLYNEEDIQEAMKRFERNQTQHAVQHQVADIDTTEAQMKEREQEAVRNNKAHTGESLKEAAAKALGVKSKS